HQGMVAPFPVGCILDVERRIQRLAAQGDGTLARKLLERGPRAHAQPLPTPLEEREPGDGTAAHVERAPHQLLEPRAGRARLAREDVAGRAHGKRKRALAIAAELPGRRPPARRWPARAWPARQERSAGWATG